MSELYYNWNNDWRDELKEENYDVWERFASCKSTIRDIRIMTKLVMKYNMSRSKKDCLDFILNWVTGLNNQVSLYPADDEDYNKLLESIKLGK